MPNNMLANLFEVRENLLREFMLTGGESKAEILAKILEIDEQIAEEKARLEA
ncbi:MAG: hypothetical protein ACOYBM_03565 [Dethiobacteria bacterium]|jgi:hypothetical protein|nr:hypothetical protein [Bacillota bacterium]